MIPAGIIILTVAVLILAEVRVRRNRRADRIRVIEQLARTVGISPAVSVARALGWVGDGDIRSDGDYVAIRLRRWWRPSRN